MTVQPSAVAEPRARIDQFLAEQGLAGPGTDIQPLTPDASDRRYFRVRTAGAAPIVLAVYTGPVDFARLPFTNVADLLTRMGLPVPRILASSDALGILAQEDLGDVTLQAHLGGASVTSQMALYREAVSLICQLQAEGRRFESPAFVPYTLAFDVEKLTFELNFFTEHFLEGHRGARLTTVEQQALEAEWRIIVDELAGEPRVICHRDYHSRNLMLSGGRLHLIDFQDARMGPDTYDLASLLRDSYVDVTAAEVDELIAHFTAQAGIADTGEYRRRFDLMAVQRNIKALGTFGFQASARGNPAFVQYVPRTLASVRDNLARYARFGRLRGLLAAHLQELR